ncbi:hypothetical protein RchiOBHm_Chr6g0279561 [Rosa chinensis]|uniref:Uncharacterized protein n=1 Tax=Rosa chinensis TaxID=74649 RepID=A0A2P6PT09_ROSCH|nr:hypothetical protein RchiOBHm_Chr6g0279561 [Rosa chinensis]
MVSLKVGLVCSCYLSVRLAFGCKIVFCLGMPKGEIVSIKILARRGNIPLRQIRMRKKILER